MTCPLCDHENPADLIECENCGEVLVDVFGSSQAPPTDVSTPVLSAVPVIEDTAPILSASPSPTGVGVLVGGRYEILQQIGEGGMGCVYKVHDRELDKVIALKLIRSEQAADPTTVQRFKQELLLARQVTHKNVVRIYDFGESDGLKFFTMEYIDGEDLRDVIRKRGKIPPEEALPWIRQMLEGLREAHRQGVVHRDLKPQNTMIDRDGEAQLMDFGIARAADTSTMTAAGTVIGTPDYLSPEQAYGEKADHQSDLYSFGVILFEMLTGELPFQAESPISRVVVRLTQKPRKPREANGELPEHLERIILKCLEGDRSLRYQDAGDILQDLEREDVNRTVLLRLERKLGRRKPILAAAVATLVFAAALGWFLIETPEPRPEPEPVTTLAVLPFTNAMESEELEWMRTGLPDMLFTDVSQSRWVRVIPTDRVTKVLRLLDVEEQKRFDETLVESVAAQLSADHVLLGQFLESRGEIRLDLMLRSSATGMATPIKIEGGRSQVFSLVDKASTQVKGQLDLTPEQLKGDIDLPVSEVSTTSFEALQLYYEGLSHSRRGSNRNAIPFLEKAIESDAGFVMAHAKLLESYLDLGEYLLAEQVVEKVQEILDAPLPIAERLQLHATVALAKDDLETAATSYRKLAELYPDDPDIRLSLARSLERLGESQEAYDAYQFVFSKTPDSGAAVLGLGRTLVVIGRPDEGIRVLDEALDSEIFQGDLEASGMVHSILGVAYRETGQFDEAIEHLKLSLKFRREADDKRGMSTTLTNLAAVYEHRGQIDAALEAEGQAVALAEEIGDRAAESMALLNLGLTYKASGQWEQALEALRATQRIETERRDINNLPTRLIYIADILWLRGQFDDALVYLEQAQGYLDKTGDRHGQGLNLSIMGRLKGSQGKFAEALDAYLSALTAYQDAQVPLGELDVHLGLAGIYLEQGRYADAHRALLRSREIQAELELGHGSAEVDQQFGMLHLAIGRLDEAEEELGRAAKSAEEAHAMDLMPAILFGQGRLLGLGGNLTEAESVLREAHALVPDEVMELSVRSRIEMGWIFLQKKELGKAEQHLEDARREASRAGLGVLAAKAEALLAEVHAAPGDFQKARDSAREVLNLAEDFSGYPLTLRASFVLGEACEELGCPEEKLEADARTISALKWFQDHMDREHYDSFVQRPDVRRSLEKVYEALKRVGRERELAHFLPWIS